MKQKNHGSHPATHVSGKENAGTGFKPVAAGRTSRPALIGRIIALGTLAVLTAAVRVNHDSWHDVVRSISHTGSGPAAADKNGGLNHE